MTPEYKLQIGERSIVDITQSSGIKYVPEQELLISKEQLEMLETVANIEVDKSLNKWYIVNNLRMKVIPFFQQTLDVIEVKEPSKRDL